MPFLVNVADIVEANGKTVRANNLARQHRYPIGTLVRFDVDELKSEKGSSIKGVVRAFVCEHTRDCDGTPLYSMSMWDPETWPAIGRIFKDGEQYTAARFHEVSRPMWHPHRIRMEALFGVWFTGYGEESLTPAKAGEVER